MEHSLDSTPYLIFRLRESLYAVDAQAVREIVPLPEITHLDETPGYVLGVLNLRGQFVPVVDLNLRFGHPVQPRRTDDSVIVLNWDHGAVGIVVNQAQSVHSVSPYDVAPIPSTWKEVRPESNFLAGLLTIEDKMVMMLDLGNICSLAECLPEWGDAAVHYPSALSVTSGIDSTEADIALYRERACSLAEPPDEPYQGVLLPLAVVRLCNELYGIDLRAIREFAAMRNVTPVPCCPDHVRGQMNLRGDLITLVDIVGPLGLQSNSQQTERTVVVANNVNLRAGVLVDSVSEVLYLRAEDVMTDSAQMSPPGREFMVGIAQHGSALLTLLDLPALLQQSSLTVNEKPK